MKKGFQFFPGSWSFVFTIFFKKKQVKIARFASQKASLSDFSDKKLVWSPSTREFQSSGKNWFRPFLIFKSKPILRPCHKLEIPPRRIDCSNVIAGEAAIKKDFLFFQVETRLVHGKREISVFFSLFVAFVPRQLLIAILGETPLTQFQKRLRCL